MLDGLAGAFFRPLALSSCSRFSRRWWVALTITPALALLPLPPIRRRESRLVGGLKARYRRLLPVFVDRPKTAMGSLAAMLLVTAVTVPFLGEEFLPKFREYDFLMHWVEKPGTLIEPCGVLPNARAKSSWPCPASRIRIAHRSRRSRRRSGRPNFTELSVSLDHRLITSNGRPDPVDCRRLPGLYRDLWTYCVSASRKCSRARVRPSSSAFTARARSARAQAQSRPGRECRG